jgi:hypothetical protein
MRVRLKFFYLLLKRSGFYLPFTWYFVIFTLAGIAAYKWLQNKAGVPDSAYKDIFALLLLLVTWFSVIILCLGLFSVIVSFLFFKWKQKKGQIDFRISVPASDEQSRSKQLISIYIHPVLKPLLGFIKLRLRYDKTKFSEKFHLIKQNSNKIFNTTLEGSYNWSLPEIKEYRVQNVIIYFEDFFQFFSLALKMDTSNSFHTQPRTEEAQIIKAFPRKTEDTSTRIEELKRVEGEHINYKNFESNDDVRRIVWKIYAKNKELVVRIPEIMDPYASHVYFYASFYSIFDVQGNEVIEIPFLNYYKTICWSVYKQLSQKGFEVRFIADQDVPSGNMATAEEQAKYTISVSKWQKANGIKDYIKPKDASVVVVSSLNDIEEVKDLLEKYGNEISFVFVPLTECLNKQQISDWIQWLFIQQEKDDTSVYKTNWSLSLLRKKITQNEDELKELLDQYQKSTVLHKQLKWE